MSVLYTTEQKNAVRRKRRNLFHGGEENYLLNLYPSVKYQVFEGFGGAATESAGYIYGQMSREQKTELLHEYFEADKMGYRMARIPIDSCDFSWGIMRQLKMRQIKHWNISSWKEWKKIFFLS